MKDDFRDALSESYTPKQINAILEFRDIWHRQMRLFVLGLIAVLVVLCTQFFVRSGWVFLVTCAVGLLFLVVGNVLERQLEKGRSFLITAGLSPNNSQNIERLPKFRNGLFNKIC